MVPDGPMAPRKLGRKFEAIYTLQEESQLGSHVGRQPMADSENT